MSRLIVARHVAPCAIAWAICDGRDGRASRCSSTTTASTAPPRRRCSRASTRAKIDAARPSSSPARRTAPATSTTPAASTATSTRWSTSATRSDPRLDWWFDHHVSGFPDARRRAALPQRTRAPHKFFDPKARSCTKFLADTCARDVRLGLSRVRASWCAGPTSSTARSSRARKAAVELAEPALQLMTWVENNHDPALKLRFIDELTRAAARRASPPSPTSQARSRRSWRATSASHRRHPRARHARARRGHLRRRRRRPRRLQQVHPVLPVSRVPLRRRRLADADARQGLGRLEPVAAARRTANIAQICERYGGGGHPVVGAVSLKTAELPRARAGRRRDRRRAAPGGAARRCSDAVVRRGLQARHGGGRQRGQPGQEGARQRYDFRGTNTEIERTDEGIVLRSADKEHLAGRLQGADGEAGQARRVAALRSIRRSRSRRPSRRCAS